MAGVVQHVVQPAQVGVGVVPGAGAEHQLLPGQTALAELLARGHRVDPSVDQLSEQRGTDPSRAFPSGDGRRPLGGDDGGHVLEQPDVHRTAR